MACRLYNTERCLQLQLFNRPNFGVHFKAFSIFTGREVGGDINRVFYIYYIFILL
jgi:hypothetical protein